MNTTVKEIETPDVNDSNRSIEEDAIALIGEIQELAELRSETDDEDELARINKLQHEKMIESDKLRVSFQLKTFKGNYPSISALFANGNPLYAKRDIAYKKDKTPSLTILNRIRRAKHADNAFNLNKINVTTFESKFLVSMARAFINANLNENEVITSTKFHEVVSTLRLAFYRIPIPKYSASPLYQLKELGDTIVLLNNIDKLKLSETELNERYPDYVTVKQQFRQLYDLCDLKLPKSQHKISGALGDAAI